MIFDLPNIIDGDMKKSMTEHTNELIKKHEELPRKQESGTMAEWHSTGWDRSGDLDLYICCLQRITALFFTFNHQNYSRWLTVITTSYLNLRIMIPTFMKSSRRVACHSNEHHLISIDLTLEQTINADAVCQHSGLILLTNSISARQYWAQSHSICTSILSGIFWGAGNDKHGRYLRRAQATPTETKLPSLDNSIHQRCHESHCFNHWERASLQYS